MNNYGYVVAHHCCQTIEVAFYTTVVRMNKEKMAELNQQLATLYYETDQDTDHNLKRFGVQVDKNTRMALTLFELKQLMEMIEESSLMMQAYELMEP
jgi:hypothetical protein